MKNKKIKRNDRTRLPMTMDEEVGEILMQGFIEDLSLREILIDVVDKRSLGLSDKDLASFLFIVCMYLPVRE